MDLQNGTGTTHKTFPRISPSRSGTWRTQMTLPSFTNIQMGWRIETRKPSFVVSKNDQNIPRWFDHTFVEGPSQMPGFITQESNLGMLWGNVRQHLWVPFRIRFPLKEVFPFKVKKKECGKILVFLSWVLRLRPPTIVQSSTSPLSAFQVLPSAKRWSPLTPPWELGICVLVVEIDAITVREVGTTMARIFSEQTVGSTSREPTTWQRALAKVDHLKSWPLTCKLTRLTLTLDSWQMQV